jgi:DNA-binding MarR family transcriptional regulator
MADVRWLDEEEQKAWRSYVRATRLLDNAIQRDLACHGFSHDEYEILVALSERPCRSARMSELAESVVNSRSRLTHTVGRLESRGYVRREASPDDRRGVLCVMTDEGFQVLELAARSHVSGVRENLLDQMSREEFLALGAALDGVRRHLENDPC